MIAVTEEQVICLCAFLRTHQGCDDKIVFRSHKAHLLRLE